MNIHLSKRLKTITNNQENDKYISSSEIKEIISNTKDTNMKKLKNIFNISKFYDNKVIKWILLLYKNKSFISIMDLNEEISKDEYKIILDLKRWYDFSLSDPYIIENGNENLLKFLVKHGVDIKSVGYKNGKIPLFDACESGNKDFVEYLIEHGEDINKEEIWSGRTPLFDACKSGNKDLVEYLVQHGADINKENGDGKTPLFKACKSGNKKFS